MKTLTIGFIFLCIVGISLSDDYTYTITDYQPLPDLTGTQTMLIKEDGGGGMTSLYNQSFLTIEATSPLVEGSGGIWTVRLFDSTKLLFTGGELNELRIRTDAEAILKGGLIESIYSYQIVPDPHITLYYSGAMPTVQEIGGFEYLVGNWGNGDPFSIYLHDTGYDVYGNFEFILVPEPITFALLAFGGLMLRGRK